MANDKRPAPSRRTGARTSRKGGPTPRRTTGDVPVAARSQPEEGSPRTPTASTRYTPPVPRAAKVSPAWLPWAMLGLFVLGVAVIFLHYVDAVLPGASSSWWLFAGLGSILGGLIAATQYR